MDAQEGEADAFGLLATGLRGVFGLLAMAARHVAGTGDLYWLWAARGPMRRSTENVTTGSDEKNSAAWPPHLRAELAGCRRALLTNAQQLKDPQAGTFLMPDLAHSIRIMPEMVSKFGLLDEETVKA